MKTLETGITYRRHLPFLVPEVEERDAARFNGYSWKEWLELPRYDRVDGLAYFRLRRILEMNVEDAQVKDQKRQQRRADRKRRG